MDAADRPSLSVVFSFWNEEAVLPELIRRTRAVLHLLRETGHISRAEMIFVNDASTDRSADVIRAEAEGHDDVRLINMSRNFGVSPCALAGIRHARGDAVIYMDADLQDPPEVIPELVHVWRTQPGVDVVHTVRRSRAGESAVKRWLTRLGYSILRGLSSIDLPVEAGDFKLLSRRAARHVSRMNEKRPFLRGLVCWIGFDQRFVYYDRAPRHAGKTKFPVLGFKVIRNFLDSAVISFSDAPLKAPAVLGLASMAAGLAAVAWIALRSLQGHDAGTLSAILAALLFMGGLQLASLGMMGRYLSTIYLETKARPNYIIKDTFGFPRKARAKSRRPILKLRAASDGSG
jgi:dolichol-phosphate mannosyltransferase